MDALQESKMATVSDKNLSVVQLCQSEKNGSTQNLKLKELTEPSQENQLNSTFCFDAFKI